MVLFGAFLASDSSEACLVARSGQGDQRAFADLVGRYQQTVFGYAARMLRDQDLADDATQEAFIAAYHAIGSFQGGSFRHWVLRIVHNKGLDLLRARGRHPADSLNGETAPDPPAPPDGTPDAWVERASLGELIERGLATLSPEQRAAVLLREAEGLTYEEIAQVLTVDLGTVKSRIARGRHRLRDFLLAHRELLPTDVRLPS